MRNAEPVKANPPDGGARGRDSAHKEGAARPSLLKRLWPLLALAAIAVFVVAMGWHRYLSFQQLAEQRQALKTLIDQNFVLALGAFMALYTVVVALSLPAGAVLTIAGGLLFGWLTGGIATVIAATAGATILFLIAKTSLGEPLAARAGPWLDRLREGFQKNALNYLLFLRLVPLFPFWLVNLAPALLGVRLRDFVLGTAIGIIPGTFAFSITGAGLDSVLDAQRRVYQACLARKAQTGEKCEFMFDAGALITPELLIAFAVLGGVALIPVIVKRFRKNG